MLLIHEIYTSILGESQDWGRPCVIVRLTGCHRRCQYCDTEYAFTGGTEMSVSEICRAVTDRGYHTVLVTGGEPLLQEEVVPLLQQLQEAGHHVVLETSGTRAKVALQDIPTGVRRVVDIKTPASGIPDDQIDWEGLLSLGSTDELKFVCCDRGDYEWARALVKDADRLPTQTPVTFSPAQDRLAAADLASWILADRLEVRLQVQLHKVIWPHQDRGI